MRLHADSEDSEEPESSLGEQVILLVLSCAGSCVLIHYSGFSIKFCLACHSQKKGDSLHPWNLVPKYKALHFVSHTKFQL